MRADVDCDDTQLRDPLSTRTTDTQTPPALRHLLSSTASMQTRGAERARVDRGKERHTLRKRALVCSFLELLPKKSAPNLCPTTRKPTRQPNETLMPFGEHPPTVTATPPPRPWPRKKNAWFTPNVSHGSCVKNRDFSPVSPQPAVQTWRPIIHVPLVRNLQNMLLHTPLPAPRELLPHGHEVRRSILFHLFGIQTRPQTPKACRSLNNQSNRKHHKHNLHTVNTVNTSKKKNNRNTLNTLDTINNRHNLNNQTTPIPSTTCSPNKTPTTLLTHKTQKHSKQPKHPMQPRNQKTTETPKKHPKHKTI